MEPTDLKHPVQQSLTQIRELLEKHRLVETLTHVQNSTRPELVDSLTHRQNLAELRNRLTRMHVADIAYVLENLPPRERLVVWGEMPAVDRGEVLAELSESVLQDFVNHIDHQSLSQALSKLDADDLSYLAEALPQDVLHERLRAFSAEERSWLTSSINYPEEKVGHFMSSITITAREHDTLHEVAQQLRAHGELPSHTDKLFILDRRGLFKGVLPLTSLLLHDPQLQVAEVMAIDVVTFQAIDDVNEAALAFERYDLVSAPVLNERGKLMGRLTVDVMMDHLRESNTEDMLRLAGLNKEEDLFVTIWKSARNRWLWLSVNLLTAFIASRVIGLFEASIEQLVALAALMPIVASIAGNTGNQTTALVLRAITLGQLSAGNMFFLIRKEIGIGVLNGVLLGVVVGLFAYAFYGNWELGAVICAAVLITLIIAAGVGLAVPLTLEKLGKDPAMGTSVIITAATDSFGFLIFLGLATLVLLP